MSKETEVTFEQIERETFIGNALATGGHYQAVKPNQYFKVTGNRYNGSNTPDIVRDLWSTPYELVAWMESEYGDYDIDAAASKENAVCEKFYSKETNCLKRWWGSNKHIWLNPPYSNITPFVKKAIEQMEHNNQIDMLLPCDTSTGWFYEAQQRAAEIIWITGEVYQEDGTEYSRTGRLAFTSALTGKPVQGNNKGSVIFIMRELKEGEQQKTRYVKISDICPSVADRRARKRS
ncbi:DNA methyltransferase [Escherichia phage aaroes]|uniref:Putative DNA N-6-adenine-methyltransferase n=3 Tax=Hanrivervirus TaxID=2560145 RepID=A0A6B9WJU1_9CAUD|nr:DNA methyltransferase [Escherichia phage grams]YP_009901952.1 DNA methyltransferase [Escherichia phage aaroes]YP_009901981.1 DNA methyltransferase [Escherichia phage damhaus]QHR65257.1 putative DNA N-6-adenine-methyltransferase [Escherichia phage grams]QHR65797.1 putative DNA N-6-adenine-methyltransferase [Escherichia phage aaroes]QHR69944.1 putative DNA N-6-adenine-methyltransferase [Escherichia phage damhaus]